MTIDQTGLGSSTLELLYRKLLDICRGDTSTRLPLAQPPHDGNCHQADERAVDPVDEVSYGGAVTVSGVLGGDVDSIDELGELRCHEMVGMGLAKLPVIGAYESVVVQQPSDMVVSGFSVFDRCKLIDIVHILTLAGGLPEITPASMTIRPHLSRDQMSCRVYGGVEGSLPP